jgi:4-hydroxybenzoate polyprenyltransferase
VLKVAFWMIVFCLYIGFLAGWQMGLGLAVVMFTYPAIYFIYGRGKGDPEKEYPMNKWKY